MISRTMSYSLALAAIVMVVLWMVPSAFSQVCLPGWVQGDPMSGTDNTVLCSLVWTPPGAEKPWLVIGGKFRVAGNVLANGIAAWDGERWHSFGTGVTDDNFFEVNAFEVYNGELYVGGWFDGIDGKPIPHLARWDGSEWQAVGEGVNGWTRTLHVFNGELIAAGDFTMAGGKEALRIAKWNGVEWSNVGAGFSHGVTSLHTFNGDLIAGGCFGNSGGTPLGHIARWDGSLWQPIGAGVPTVFDLATYQGNLVAVGSVASTTSVRIWDGTNWMPVGNLQNTAYTVKVFEGELVVGTFSAGVVRMIGYEWHLWGYGPLGLGLAPWSNVYTLIEYNGCLFVGGDIIQAEDFPVRNIARWTGTLWTSFGVGSDGSVLSYTRHNDVPCIGGVDLFNSGYVAELQDGEWVILGSPFNSRVSAVISYGGYLIAGGTFNFSLDGTFFGIRIAKWDGQQWSNMGGFNGEILKFLIIDDELIAMGMFTMVGGAPTSRVARWNGQTWQPMFPNTEFNGTVRDVIRIAGHYFVAGDFTTINAQPISYVAHWDGTQWHALDLGVNGPAHALAEFQGELIAGGAFTIAGDVDAKAIARWDGVNWNSLGIGLLPCEGQSCEAVVRSLVPHGDLLYAAGVFNYASNSGDVLLESVNFAQWDGGLWSAIPPGVGFPYPAHSVHSMIVDDSKLILTGSFNEAGGQPANHIVAFTPGSVHTWFPAADGFDSSVNDVIEFQNDLIIAGNFQNTPAGFHNRITRWDGSAWHDLDGGMDGYVRAIETYGDSLIAGGLFTIAGNAPAKSLAKWNGSSWSELAPVTGSFGEVRALEVCGDDLYIGGQFQSVGGVATPNIARWDGSAVQPLGAGLSGPVNAIIFHQGELIAGGAFATAGGATVNSVSRWDGAAWHALDTGVSICPPNLCNATVYAMAIHDGDLVVGGNFVYAGSEPASNIARWDGNSWHTMGAGFNGAVRALCSFKGQLYAAGSFTLADGILVHRIAVWNGFQWNALPEGGLDSDCFGTSCNFAAGLLTPIHGDLFVGGSFTQVGSTASPYLARLINPCSSGDLNSDGAVNLLDLLHVIQQWGPCSIASYCDDTPCDADANFDSAVNVHDLLIVIGAWTG